MTTVNLIIQIVAGIVGGNVAGFGMKNLNLGAVGNTIAGAIGGVGGGLLLGALLPADGSVTFFNVLTVTGAGGDFGSIVVQLIGGAAGGGILTAVVGLIKNAMAGGKAG
jgi:hypothetical protein